MKRSIFKLGRYFDIETTSDKDSFGISVDLVEWAKNDDMDSWKFDLRSAVKNHPSGTFPVEDRGTQVTVTALRSEVAMQFKHSWFITGLRNAIRGKQSDALARGLEIILNGERLTTEVYKLVDIPEAKPAWTKHIFNGVASPLHFRCIAGISKPPNPTEASGWYIICNGRTVLRAERRELVGWGEKDFGIPAYHAEYASLKVTRSWDTDNPARLPWNTSKTDLDTDSKAFIDARQLMLKAMEPVVSFIRKAYEAQSQGAEALSERLKTTLEVPIDSISAVGEFTGVVPKVVTPKEPMSTIASFQKPKAAVDQVKSHLKTKYLKDLGGKPVDYYYEYEIKS